MARHGDAVNDEWDRRPFEPIRWYARFELYRLLGSGRSVDSAFRLDSGQDTSHKAGASWWANARKWEWQRRAESWDMAERDRLRAADEERRRVARERRLHLLGEIRESSWTAILAANLAKLNADGTPVLSEEVARSMLGSLRLMFFDALRGERLEMGEATDIVGSVAVPGLKTYVSISPEDWDDKQ